MHARLGGGDFDDLLVCVDDVVARGIGDPERLSVGGYSYGGFMTTWVVGHDHRFKQAVVGAPVVDQASMIGTTDIAGCSPSSSVGCRGTVSRSPSQAIDRIERIVDWIGKA